MKWHLGMSVNFGELWNWTSASLSNNLIPPTAPHFGKSSYVPEMEIYAILGSSLTSLKKSFSNKDHTGLLVQETHKSMQH